MLEKNEVGQPAQQLVQVSEVRDGIIILPNNTLRAVLIVSSMNFALKSEEEQNAIIYAFQGFLNSLDFPIQVLVTSRQLDITSYLEELSGRKEQQSNELLALQMGEYINFITELVKDSNIMTKTFFVTVSFAITDSRQLNLLAKVSKGLAGLGKKTSSSLSEADFNHYKKQLLLRVEQVAVGLRNISLRVAPLQTQEVLELLYNTFNPSTARNMKLTNVTKINAQETQATGYKSPQK